MSDWTLYTGDCLNVLPTLASGSVDTVISDPPAGIRFMDLPFDSDRGGRLKWVEWLASALRECLRVAKPGATAAVWALPRTSHWTGCALEEAGWEIFDVVTHLFGGGFPKGVDVGKAIDRAAGAEREVIGERPWTNARMEAGKGVSGLKQAGGYAGEHEGERVRVPLTAPATDAARLWDGWHSQLKPAAEFWWLARKPLDGTYAHNALAHGVAGLNVNGCRIPCADKADFPAGVVSETERIYGGGKGHADRPRSADANPTGRYPANLVLSHHPSCVRRGTKRVKGSNQPGRRDGEIASGIGFAPNTPGKKRKAVFHTDPGEYGTETVEDWECHEDCPVRLLDEQAGERKSGGGDKGNKGGTKGWFGLSGGNEFTHHYEADSGGPSRFFTRLHYCGKASRRERGEGNTHATVKPLALMRWLCRLTKTPTGGVVLDPFAGSGTTLLAALLEGRRAIGIEVNEGYAAVARSRLAEAEGPLFAQVRERTD